MGRDQTKESSVRSPDMNNFEENYNNVDEKE
jgi:hypothetical protein